MPPFLPQTTFSTKKWLTMSGVYYTPLTILQDNTKFNEKILQGVGVKGKPRKCVGSPTEAESKPWPVDMQTQTLMSPSQFHQPLTFPSHTHLIHHCLQLSFWALDEKRILSLNPLLLTLFGNVPTLSRTFDKNCLFRKCSVCVVKTFLVLLTTLIFCIILSSAWYLSKV